MTSELVNIQTNLPAFAQKKSSMLQDMGGGMAESTPSISLRGSRFRFVKNGAEIKVLEGSFLDVIFVGVSAYVQRTFFKGAYDASKDSRPACSSLNGMVPNHDSPEAQALECAGCPQNVKQPDPRRPDEMHTPCSYSKDIVVMLPGDTTSTLWRMRLSAMTAFNNEVGNDPSQMGFKALLMQMGAMNADPVNYIIRLTMDSAASVPALLFGVVGTLGDGGLYDEPMYNRVIESMDKAEKILGNPTEAGQPTGTIENTLPDPAPAPAPAPAPVAETTAAPVVEQTNVEDANVVMDNSAEDVSDLLAMFKS